VWPFAIKRFDSLAIQENVSGTHSTEGSVGPIAALSGVPRNFVRGVQQIQLRTEGRENRDLEAVAP